jgi:hypothetical protein
MSSQTARHEAQGSRAKFSAVGSALLWRNPKTKRPRRVLLTPARPYSTEEDAFDAAG